MSVLDWMVQQERKLDSRLRHWDFGTNRTVGGKLAKHGISRHTSAAVTIPALLVLMMVNGPALRPTIRLLVAVVVAWASMYLFRWALAQTEKRNRAPWVDLAVQLALLAVVGGAVWFVAPAEAYERSPSLLYRHALVPVTAVISVALLLSAVLVAIVFHAMAPGAIPVRLTEVELFELRPQEPKVTWAMLVVAAVEAVTSSPGRVLWMPALAALVVDRELVRPVFVIALVVNLVVLAFANLDPRFSASWKVLYRLTFRHWSRVVSAVLIALGVARVMNFQYVSTIFDGARAWTIVGYLLFAYILAWWWDYWRGTLVALRFLDVLRGNGRGASSARVDYPIRREVITTRVPESGRVIQTHGAGRLLVMRDEPPTTFFHTYEPETLTDALSDGSDRRSRADLVAVRWRLNAHFLLSAVVLAAVLYVGGQRLSRLPQLAHIQSTQRQGNLAASSTLLPAAACTDSGTVIAVAGSGGGTRAALYTASVLERLRRLDRLADVRIVSGVSGGGAALAYFVAHRDVLLQSRPDSAGEDASWNTFIEAMQQPYIEDVIDGSGEWRIASNTRLGRLLAESFERRWKSQARFGDVTGVGIILNSAIAGRFIGSDGSEMSLAEQEARARKLGRSDVTGGRVVYTNLNLDDHLANPDLFDGDGRVDTRDARLPIFVIEDPDVRLADAAAANANFPPVFSNAAVDRAKALRLWVTDGGAIDNRGLETMLMALKLALTTRGDCARLPTLHIVEAEASAFSNAYSQDRGLGSMMSAGTAFASQLDSELLHDIREVYRANGQDPAAFVHFHFVPMPAPLRRSGSFGTHWMMQAEVPVCVDQACDSEVDLAGGEVVTILRSLYAESPPDSLSEGARMVFTSIRQDTLPDYARGWARLETCVRSPGRRCE